MKLKFCTWKEQSIAHKPCGKVCFYCDIHSVWGTLTKTHARKIVAKFAEKSPPLDKKSTFNLSWRLPNYHKRTFYHTWKLFKTRSARCRKVSASEYVLKQVFLCPDCYLLQGGTTASDMSYLRSNMGGNVYRNVYINRGFLLFLQKTNLAVAIFWGSDPATAQYARNKMALLKNDGVPFASSVEKSHRVSVKYVG